MKLLLCILLLIGLAGCKTLDNTNEGAREVGETAGKVLKVPGSVNEGMADGQRKPSGPNPYGR